MSTSSNPFVRAWRYLKSLLHGKLDQWEDPEIIINDAVREMKESQIKNREMAVQAITQRNNLQKEVDNQERTVADLEKKAMMALQGGNRELAKQFLKEKATYEQTLGSMRENLIRANDSVDKVKVAIRSEEERIRQRTSEALALKANLKQAQIQNRLAKALDSFQFSDTESNWSAAKERIASLQSEADARSEITGTSIDSKMREMELTQMDVVVDQELAELEMKMSNNPALRYNTSNTQQIQTVGGGTTPNNGNGTGASVPESDLDRQLKELEERLGKK
ncbi:MAG: PspA/IM30 family protein [Armatimonadetes bacterium]|nr:PspA/IM30 family protein [Armatimonadota bacterium]